MDKPGGPKGPKTQPDKTPPPKPAKPEKAKESKEKKGELTKKMNEALGAGFMYDLKIILKLWGKLWTQLDGIGDKFENFRRQQDVRALSARVRGIEKKIKIPKITNADKLRTKFAVMKATDSTVKYLYASLEIQIPKLDQIKPPTKEIKLPHLIKQLKDSNISWREGKKAILEQSKKRPPKLYKGDLVLLNSSTGELIAGFIESMDDKTIYIKNNTSSKPIKESTSNLFLAFHFPGNKINGAIPNNEKTRS